MCTYPPNSQLEWLHRDPTALSARARAQLFGACPKTGGSAMDLGPQMLVGLNKSAAGCTHGWESGSAPSLRDASRKSM